MCPDPSPLGKEQNNIKYENLNSEVNYLLSRIQHKIISDLVPILKSMKMVKVKSAELL